MKLYEPLGIKTLRDNVTMPREKLEWHPGIVSVTDRMPSVGLLVIVGGQIIGGACGGQVDEATGAFRECWVVGDFKPPHWAALLDKPGVTFVVTSPMVASAMCDTLSRYGAYQEREADRARAIHSGALGALHEFMERLTAKLPRADS
jgi:hypothetical protein